MSQPTFFNSLILIPSLDGGDGGTLVEDPTLGSLAHMSSLRRGVDDQVIEAS